jgi:putative membrane protein
MAHEKLAKRLNVLTWVITIVVLLLVGVMRRPEVKEIAQSIIPFDTSFLPGIHASLNALVAVILILALIAIKQKKILLHKRLMIAALICSFLFLLSYVIYHLTNEETRFGGEGSIRYVYFFLLITHVILAAVTLPFILFTFIRGITRQDERHRKMARWIYPLWLYVAISGPLCYLMLKPYYL